MAPRHIGQGSHVVYRSQPESWKSPSLRQASRIATTSACAVGSFVVVTRLAPSATTRPSFTTSAANGPPPQVRTFSIPKAMARRIKSADMILCPCFRVPFLLPIINVPFFGMRGFANHRGNGGQVTFGIADKQGSDFLARARQVARHHPPHLIWSRQMR